MLLDQCRSGKLNFSTHVEEETRHRNRPSSDNTIRDDIPSHSSFHDFSLDETNPKKNDSHEENTLLLYGLDGNKLSRSDRAWENKFKLLLHYYHEHGHTLIPTTDPTLGRWVQRQRSHYKKGTLNDYRRMALMSLKFVFDVHEHARLKRKESTIVADDATTMPNSNEEEKNRRKWRKHSWDERHMELSQYFCQNGHSNVPLKHGSLGGWVQYQRRSRSKLSMEQRNKLEQLNFVWNVKSHQWNIKYQELREFLESHGHCHVPSTEEYKTLQAWCGTQRHLYRIKYEKSNDNNTISSSSSSSALTNEREELLASIGFDWETNHAYIWNQRIEQLKRYKQTHGHVNLTKGGDGSSSDLGAWVDTQRTEYRFKIAGHHTHLTDERVAELELLGMVWNVRDWQWNENYDAVLQYFVTVRQNNSKCPPEDKAEDKEEAKLSPSLAIWFRDQKKLYRGMTRGEQTPLTEERVGKLGVLIEESNKDRAFG